MTCRVKQLSVNELYRTRLKRVFDFLISVSMLILLTPLLVLISLLIIIHFGRPVLFYQQRPGLEGQLFTIYKFRTMTDERDRDGRMLPDEKRLTSIGRFLRSTSFDELPELINVIRGDMSLIGPRPLLAEYLALYSAKQARRHEVKPGITGWAQVNGRNALSWEKKFELDVWYVDNLSFWLDVKILGLTVLRLLERKGISQPGEATVRYFEGND